jgi:hypothetical protein
MEDSINTILEVSMSYAVPRCLHVIAELGVADAIGENPRTAADLAASTGADAGSLARALRLGVWYFRIAQRWLRPHASFAVAPHRSPPVDAVLRSLVGTAIVWESFELLNHSLRTGQPATEQVMPGGFWAYLVEHPETGKIFDDAMTGKAHGQIAGILSSYDFSPFATIADIGGGRGHLLQAVLGAAPNATGILFDLPHVAEQLAATASARFKVQAGDFFKDPLPVCDAYMIMQVIHDWSDREAVAILSAIRRAAPAHAKLLLIEGIVPEDSNPSWIKMLDIFMLALFTGKERSRREFEALLAASGFRLDKVIHVGLGTSILEASVMHLG